MLLADLHLMGNFLGYWADRIKRESQIRTAFQAAVRQLEPDVIFILGDVLDEGKWAFTHQFHRMTRRYNRYFSKYVATRNIDIKLHVVTGNHDIGFHYDTNSHKV